MVSAATAAIVPPRDIDEVNPAWLNGVLARSRSFPSGATIAAVRPELLGAGLGQTGVTARLCLTYEGAPGPDSLIIKLSTADPARRSASKQAELYRQEVSFYGTIAPQISLRTPDCHAAVISENGEFCLLLIEDFPDHRTGSQIDGASRYEASLGVDALVRLHAPFWGRSELLRLPSVSFPPISMIATGWDGMVAEFGDYMTEDFRSARNAFLDALPRLLKWRASGTTTLLHADFKLDNLLYGMPDNPDAIVVIDWQTMLAARGVIDLAQFITHNLSPEDRRNWEPELIGQYVGGLNDRGVAYSLSDAQADYRTALIYLLVYAAWTTGINVNDHPLAVQRKQLLLKRISSSLDDWEAIGTLPALM